MVFESSLAPAATQFADSLNVRPAPGAEKTGDDLAKEAKTSGLNVDVVSISEEARALAAVDQSGNQGDNPFGLSDEDQERANLLFGELYALFTQESELTEAQGDRIGAIFEELDELLPVNDLVLTEEEEEQLDVLFRQLDDLYAGDPLTPSQEKRAMKIEDRIEALFVRAEERAEDGQVEPMATLPDSSDDDTMSPTERIIDQLQKQIEELEEEIKAIEESDLPQKQKNMEIQEKQAQIMMIREQLEKAEEAMVKAMGHADGGGTRAQGFGNSVSTF